MHLVLMRRMRRWFKLKGRVRHVEVTSKTILQPIQNLRCVAAREAMVIKDDVRRHRGNA